MSDGRVVFEVDCRGEQNSKVLSYKLIFGQLRRSKPRCRAVSDPAHANCRFDKATWQFA